MDATKAGAPCLQVTQRCVDFCVNVLQLHGRHAGEDPECGYRAARRCLGGLSIIRKIGEPQWKAFLRARKLAPAASASPRGRVLGLVERFVVGDPKGQLILPIGDGSEPLFKRMRHPNECVVEMRTVATRSFGFFTGLDTFAALFLEEVRIPKEKPAPGQSSGPSQSVGPKGPKCPSTHKQCGLHNRCRTPCHRPIA